MKFGIATYVAAVVFAIFGLGLAAFAVRREKLLQGDLLASQRTELRLDIAIRAAKRRAESLAAERDMLLRAPVASRQMHRAAIRHRDPDAAFFKSHPQILDLYLKNFRAALREQYGVFYHMAGLSDDQIAQFEALITRHRADVIALKAIASVPDGVRDSAEITEVRNEQNDLLVSDEIAVLGPVAYQQLQQFNREQGALGLINGAALLALGPSDAYSYDQAAQLMQILANGSASFQSGGVFEPTSVDWNKIVQHAQAVLSPSQVAALKAQAEAMQLMTQLVPNFRANEDSGAATR